MTQTITHDDVVVEIEQQVRALLPEYDGELSPSSRFEDLNLDSLTQIDLLAAMEIAFGVEVPDEDVAKVASIQDLADLVVALMDRG